jgi:hypothetical protein
MRVSPPDPGVLVPLVSSSPLAIAIRALHEAGAARFQRELRAMRDRLQLALTDERVRAARPILRELERLQDIPLDQLRHLVPGTRPQEGMVRTGFNCNQDCGLCWQGRKWGGYGSDQILKWIEDLREAGATQLSISGGEPTLDPALPDYLRRARAVGFETVMLQTNAIQMAKPGLAERLLEAGLDTALVSLHSGDAKVSDSITRAPGTHGRTVTGIARLLDAGVAVNLNCVMTPESLTTLETLPDFVHESFGSHPKLIGLVLSIPMAPFDLTIAKTVVPDPTVVREVLPRALQRASELGVRIHNLEGPCGPQLCAFDADPRFASLVPLPSPVSFRKQLPACAECAVRESCFGVRLEQFERFGDACARPIRR